MKLVKAHGLGNDYLVLADGPPMNANRVIAICDRHTGVGGDGILEPVPASNGADYGVRIWNPDGSIAEKSGNGLRIFAQWLHDTGAPDTFSIWAGVDLTACTVRANDISVGLGRAVPGAVHTLDTPAGTITGRIVHTGNPHFVCAIDDVLDDLPWRVHGKALEVNPVFPNRTNVQFTRVISPDTLEIRIWERGAGETLASGSSSCASVAAAVIEQRLQPGEITVKMPGGTLQVQIDAELNLVLTGPVAVVAHIDVDERWLAELD